MNPTQTLLACSALAGAFAFVGEAEASNIIVNSSFDNDSGVPITGTGNGAGPRTITGWGSLHLYNHTYNGTTGPKLGDVTNLPAYGVNDNILITETSGTGGTYKGLGTAATQMVNLNTTLSLDVISSIDSGTAQFAFSAWMANDGGNDTPATQLRFFSSTDGTGTALGTFVLDRGVTTNQLTTADILMNPGGANNAISQTNKKYWALYEIQSSVPTGARSVVVNFVAGTGHDLSGQADWYADHVVVDIVAPVPEPSAALLGGLGALGLLRRRRQA